MKITQPRSNQLILEHQPLLVWLFGGVFGVAGLWMIFHSGGVAWLIPVAISVFIITSMGQIVTCVFDKAEGRFTLKQQGVFGTKMIEQRIRDISDIQVEQSVSSEGTTYRVTIRFTTGEHVPLTEYYSSGITDKQKTADRIRAFLNLSDSTAPSDGSRWQPRQDNRAESAYPPTLPGITASKTAHGLFLSLRSTVDRDAVQHLVRELPRTKMLSFTDPRHRGPMGDPDYFFLSKRNSDYLMMSHGERWGSSWTPIAEVVLVQYFMELSKIQYTTGSNKTESYKVSVADYTDYSNGSLEIDRTSNAEPGCFVRSRVSEALKPDLDLAEQNAMTPELWRTLGEIANKPVISRTDDPTPLPTGIDTLKWMGYVDMRAWGAGDRGVEYFILEQGNRALAAYQASQP